jgi:hypothetical protein
MANQPILRTHGPLAVSQERISGEILVEDLLLRDRPTAAKSPADAHFVGEICETVIPEEKHIGGIFKGSFEPFARRAHVLRGVVKIIEIVTQKDGRRSRVCRANVIDYPCFVVNIGDDKAGLIVHARAIFAALIIPVQRICLSGELRLVYVGESHSM